MNRNVYLVGIIMLTFFVISLLTNIIGPLVPQIIDDFRLSLTLVALLPFAFFIAYGVASIPSGVLIERFSARGVTVAGFFLAFAGALAFALFPTYLVSVPSFFVIGTGMAMVQVAIHPILRTAGGEENFAFYSVLSGLFFGLASFLSPLVYSYLVLNLPDPASGNVLLALLSEIVPPELPWTSLYWIFAAVSLLMVVVVAATPFPAPVLGDEDRVGTWRTHLDLIRQPLVVLYFLGIVSYVGIEVGVANWTSEFLASYHGYDPQTAGAQAVSLFWGLMTAGTLVGLLALKLFDSRRVLVVFTLAAVVSFSIGVFGPGPLARYALPAVGFFASVMWPIIFDLALNSVDRHHGSFSGILVTGIIGGAVVPLAIGWTGDVTSLRTGLSILYVFFGYILSIGFWANPIIRNKTFSFIEGRT